MTRRQDGRTQGVLASQSSTGSVLSVVERIEEGGDSTARASLTPRH